MAEETNTGTAPVTPPAEPSSVAQETPQAPPEVQPPQSQAPAGGGVSVEQLSERMAELERIAQEAQDRASRAEHDAQLAYNLREQLGLQRGRQEEVPEAPSVTDDEFLTNPAKATGKIIESYFERERKEREREKVTQYVETARSAYERGKQEAIKANPNLYRGIEADISREVLANVKSSLQAGQPVDAAVLSNPRYWEAAALAMRVMNGEDVSRYYMKSHNPVAPAHTETPSAGGPPKAATTLSPEQEELIARGNITREQFMESLAKVRNVAEERSR
jgi:hypothetical protein